MVVKFELAKLASRNSEDAMVYFPGHNYVMFDGIKFRLDRVLHEANDNWVGCVFGGGNDNNKNDTHHHRSHEEKKKKQIHFIERNISNGRFTVHTAGLISNDGDEEKDLLLTTTGSTDEYDGYDDDDDNNKVLLLEEEEGGGGGTGNDNSGSSSGSSTNTNYNNNHHRHHHNHNNNNNSTWTPEDEKKLSSMRLTQAAILLKAVKRATESMHNIVRLVRSFDREMENEFPEGGGVKLGILDFIRKRKASAASFDDINKTLCIVENESIEIMHEELDIPHDHHHHRRQRFTKRTKRQ